HVFILLIWISIIVEDIFCQNDTKTPYLLPLQSAQGSSNDASVFPMLIVTRSEVDTCSVDSFAAQHSEKIAHTTTDFEHSLIFKRNVYCSKTRCELLKIPACGRLVGCTFHAWRNRIIGSCMVHFPARHLCIHYINHFLECFMFVFVVNSKSRSFVCFFVA